MSFRSSVSFLLGAALAIVVGCFALWQGRGERAPDPAPHRVLSYAQQGEDLIVANLFHNLDLEVRTYLDLGAWDPVESSNTYLFYERGARGVLVEPNPAYVSKLRAKRPGDTVLAVGVGLGEHEELASYYVVDGGLSGWNTFSATQAETIRGMGKEVLVQQLPLVPVGTILERYFDEDGSELDFVSIDVEGLDFEILKLWDFERFRPKVLCVETKAIDGPMQKPGLIEFVLAQGYELRGATFVNSIFVDRELLRRLSRPADR